MNELNEIKDLIRQIIAEVNNALENGEEIPVDIQERLSDTLEGLYQRADQIESELSSAPASETSQLLWILSGGNADSFLNYARSFPDPELQALVQNPDRLRQTLQQLSVEMPQGEKPVVDGIEQAPLQSSNIYGFRYDPRTRKLQVRFQSGAVYGYDQVDPRIFQIFENGAVPAKTSGVNKFGAWWKGKNPSLGAAFYELIKKGNYPYKRLK